MSALRFLVSLYIVVYHMLVVSPWDLRVVSPIFHKGWIGTDFFIILSGFIIAIAYKEKLQSKKLSPGDFMRGRLLRLWPPHAIIMMLFLCYFLLTKAAGFTTNDPSFFAPSAFVSQLLLTNSFILRIRLGTYPRGRCLHSWSATRSMPFPFPISQRLAVRTISWWELLFGCLQRRSSFLFY